MAFSKNRFFYKTDSPTALLRNRRAWLFIKEGGPPNGFQKQAGFATVLLLLFCPLMISAMAGIGALSIGIKHITRAQSHCIRINMRGQKELGLLLEKTLALNGPVKWAHKTAEGLKLSIATATASGFFHLLPPLKKKLALVRQTQAGLKAKQEKLLAQSRIVREKSFQNLQRQFQKLKISYIRRENPHKQALAVEKEKLGESAYIYKPRPDFTHRQKSRFLWRFHPFAPFDKSLPALFGISAREQLTKGECSASLKREGKKWLSKLYH